MLLSFQPIKKKISESLLVGFLLIFFFHLIFKLQFLDFYGFWYDEVFGLYYAEQDWGLIKHTSEWDMNPPLYYYFLWIWRNLFGISEFAIRFSSVLFSSLSAGMIYVFAAKYFNRVTALVALLLFTSSNEVFFYSHEARCYSIVLFFCLCSSWFFFDLINRKSIISAIFLGLINFLLIYTHYLTGLLLLFQVTIALLIYKKQFFKQMGIAFGVTILLVLWRFTKKTILLIFHHEKSFWLGPPTFDDLKNTFFDFFNGKAFFFFYLLLILTFLIYYIKNKDRFLQENKVKIYYLLLCGIFTILISFIASMIMPVFLKRYFLYAAPFMYILIGFILSGAPNLFRNIALGVVCVLSFISFSKIDFRTEKPMNYRDAMVFIKRIKTPGTLILVETKDMGSLFAYYYDQDIFKDYYNFDSKLQEKGIYPVSNADDLSSIDLKKYDRVILTQSFEDLNPGNEALLIAISDKFKSKIMVKNYAGIKILVYHN